MRPFLVRSVIFCLLAFCGFAMLISRADGRSDPFYLRFTTPRQHNLILGTSRAAQGLLPSVFHRILGKAIFNYSFTSSDSPFGPAYLESIKKKLDPSTHDGLFIVTVDPWALTEPYKVAGGKVQFGESKHFLGRMNFVNVHPNFEYLLFHNQGPFLQLLDPPSDVMTLHRDGWLEVNVPMDPASVAQRIKRKIESYRNEMMPGRPGPAERLSYLERTIAFLKTHGRVFLVRLPVHPEMFALELEQFPDFNAQIGQVVPMCDGYLDLTPRNADFTYTDGNHLYKRSGEAVSALLAAWIQAQEGG